MDPRGKLVLVTGASQGIGQTTALRFMQEGWRVITCARRGLPDDLPRLEADPTRVRQMLVNLLVNAVKFSDPGSPVTLQVFDLLGQHVATLVDGVQTAGEHEVAFDGATLPSGVYVLRLRAGGATEKFSVDEVPFGDAYENKNSQEYGFQYGVDTPDEPFVVQTTVVAPFSDDMTPENYQSAGMQIGSGDQDNYIKLVASAQDANGDPNGGVGAMWHSATSENGWFTCPDNCAVDHQGRLWVTTDGNDFEFSGRTDGVWSLETEGELRGMSKHFYRVPVGAEMCGPKFTPDDTTLFVAVQHVATDGTVAYPGREDRPSTFEDPATRWPDFQDGMPPRPSMVVVIKNDGGVIGS